MRREQSRTRRGRGRLWSLPSGVGVLSIALVAALAVAGLGVGLPRKATDSDVRRPFLSLAGDFDPGAPALAAARAGPLRVIVKGDWGDGSPGQHAVTAAICRWRQANPFEYVLTTGDNFYWPDGQATATNFERPEACLLAGAGVRWRASWGNHDYAGTSTSDVLEAPDDPRYYAWRDGEVAFFVYDGTVVTAEQKEWLRRAVCGSDATVKVIYGHQPPFSNAVYGPNAEVQALVHTVARDCGVRLVLSGHEHLYLRTRPIDGVTYVITGGGGAGLYACGEPTSWVAACHTVNHFLDLVVDGEAVRVRAIAVDGSVLDAVTLRR